MSKETAQWFVVQTQSNKELQIQKRLLAAVDAAAKNPAATPVLFEVMVPTKKVSSVKNDKKVVQVLKTYPCYVFVKMDLYTADGNINKEAWYMIKNTPGVLGFAGNSEKPRPIKDTEFTLISEEIKESEGKVQPKYFFAVGTKVKINAGPFASLTGTVKTFNADAGTLDVNVSIFGRDTPVSLEQWQVETVKDDAVKA